MIIKSNIKDINMAEKGKEYISWASKQMPVLKQIKERFVKEKPLNGVKIAASLHITPETGNLLSVLKAGGAEIFLCGSNPLSTRDYITAALVKYEKISTFAKYGENINSYWENCDEVLSYNPNIIMDDGADLIGYVHGNRKENLKNIIGAIEETTTGVIRIKNLEKKKLLCFPVISANDACTKHLFDNRYGTGQSTIDGILRATNYLISGSTFVVCGYGWCGRGLSMRARGMGARVIVTEINHLKALEAVMDGFNVMQINDAAKIGDIFVTVTGNKSIITKNDFIEMKDGAILANSGHFDIEIDLKSLKEISVNVVKIRNNMDEYTLINGKRIIILGEGRLVNLAVAEGHPANVMDMSFAGQILATEYIHKNYKNLNNIVYTIPYETDYEIAKMKLTSLEVKIDVLTEEQKRYLDEWSEGT